MGAEAVPAQPHRPVAAMPDFERLLTDRGRDACCAMAYAHPAVRWLLGGELHPGGAALTRRAFKLIGLGSGDRLLDVASGTGSTGVLAGRELGCQVAGVDYSTDAVRAANTAAEAEWVSARVAFVRAHAGALPFADAEFDAAISECSLCLFPDKVQALAEIRRVLRPGGRLAITDVVAEADRLPGALRTPLATVACVGDALPPDGHETLLGEAGFEVLDGEGHSEAALAMADRIIDRLRGARILGLDGFVPIEGGIDAALELAAQAREAIADGSLGYVLVTAQRE